MKLDPKSTRSLHYFTAQMVQGKQAWYALDWLYWV